MKEENEELDLSQFTLESLLAEPEIETVDADEVLETEPTDVVEDTPTKTEPVTETTDDTEATEETDLSGFYEALNKEIGIEDFNIAEVEDGIPGLMGYLKTIVTNTVDSEVESIKSLGDGILGDMYEFLRNGGKVEEFKKIYFDTLDYKSLSIEGDENESNQKLIIDEYLKEQGFDDDERKDKIESYTSTGLLEKESKTALKKMSAIQDKRQTELVQRQIQAKTEHEAKVKAYWDDIVETINKSDSIGGITIPKAKKKDFADYLTVRDKDGLTGYQKKISNKEQALKAALASYLDYNDESIKKEVKTQVTQDLKKTISRFTDTAAKSKSAIDADIDTNKKPDYTMFKLPIHK